VAKLGRGIDEDKIISVFYNVVRLIILQRGRRYVNRDSLLNFFTPETLREEMPGAEDKF